MSHFYDYLCVLNGLFETNNKIGERKCDFSSRAILKDKYYKFKLKNRMKKMRKRAAKLAQNAKEMKIPGERGENFGILLLNEYKKDSKSLKPKKRRKILFDELFTKNENFGSVLDLRFILSYRPLDYPSVLKHLYDFNFDEILLKSRGINSKNKKHSEKKKNLLLLLHLQFYLTDFLVKSHPNLMKRFFKMFDDSKRSKIEVFSSKKSEDLQFYRKKWLAKYKWMVFHSPNLIFPPIKEQSNFIFCSECKEIFTLSVWEYHKKSKKHNQERIEANFERSNSLELSTFSDKTKFLDLLPTFVLYSEEDLKENVRILLTLLEQEHKTSISLESSKLLINPEDTQRIAKKSYSSEMKHFFSFKSQKLKCEVCGESFKTRSAFEFHFKQQKHTENLKLLGIDRPEHFHGISQIKNVKKLAEKYKNKK